MTNQTTRDTIKVEGHNLIGRVKQLIHEGNVRRIVIKQDENTILEMPLTIGVVGAVLAPALAAIGAVAALVTDCTIEVEREGEGETEGAGTDGGTATPPPAGGTPTV
jgi:hypothetical protein